MKTMLENRFILLLTNRYKMSYSVAKRLIKLGKFLYITNEKGEKVFPLAWNVNRLKECKYYKYCRRVVI